MSRCCFPSASRVDETSDRAGFLAVYPNGTGLDCSHRARRGRASRPAGSASHTATRVTYGPCIDGFEVVLWRLTGAGHVWPGCASDYLDRMRGSISKILGPSTDVIDANTLILQFVSRYHGNLIRQVPD